MIKSLSDSDPNIHQSSIPDEGGAEPFACKVSAGSRLRLLRSVKQFRVVVPKPFDPDDASTYRLVPHQVTPKLQAAISQPQHMSAGIEGLLT